MLESCAFWPETFCVAYFSFCRFRHRTHFVAKPLSPNAAHGRKFLHPLHHLISKLSWSLTNQTATSHTVHTPLFWRGIICVDRSFPVVVGSSGDGTNVVRGRRPPILLLLDITAEHKRSCPHITHGLVPSLFNEGWLASIFLPLKRWSGKFTSKEKSGSLRSTLADL